uniref:Ribosomal protein L1 n=1 Tax=Strigamia maritima TaxID=126957 RepID=T1JM66_STRMM
MSSTTADCSISSKQVKRSVAALYQLLEKKTATENEKKQKKLFGKGPNKISVRIQLKRAPAGNQYGWKEIKVVLPNCPTGKNSSICLIVKDLHKGRRSDDEFTIEYFKDILKKKEIDIITEIIPTHVVRTEHNTFQAKRNLSVNFDKFIADERIKMSLPTLLGKWFTEKQKLPIPISFTKSTTKAQIEKAMSHVNVANDSMKMSETVSNILDLVNQLARKLPGGWANVKSIFLSTVVKPSIPVYVSLAPLSEVDIAIDMQEYPEPEDLTTLPKGKVVVYPDGTVHVVEGNGDGDISDN